MGYLKEKMILKKCFFRNIMLTRDIHRKNKSFSIDCKGNSFRKENFNVIQRTVILIKSFPYIHKALIIFKQAKKKEEMGRKLIIILHPLMR